MDAGEALDELTRLSGVIRRAAIVDSSGAVLAAVPAVHGERLADAAAELLDVAGIVDAGRTVEKVAVSVPAGAVVVVRVDGRTAVATTRPEASTALVAHDLRACLGRLDPEPSAPAARKRKPKAVPVDA